MDGLPGQMGSDGLPGKSGAPGAKGIFFIDGNNVLVLALAGTCGFY